MKQLWVGIVCVGVSSSGTLESVVIFDTLAPRHRTNSSIELQIRAYFELRDGDSPSFCL